MNNSGNTMRSAPWADAFSRAASSLSALPSRSPTSGLSWASAMVSLDGGYDIREPYEAAPPRGKSRSVACSTVAPPTPFQQGLGLRVGDDLVHFSVADDVGPIQRRGPRQVVGRDRLQQIGETAGVIVDDLPL